MPEFVSPGAKTRGNPAARPKATATLVIRKPVNTTPLPTEPLGDSHVRFGVPCEILHMSHFRALVLAAFVAQSASAEQPQTQPRAPDRTAPSAPGNTDPNANAPDAPALDQEPHGSGSVYEELDSLRNENMSKQQGG
jgi:hypothetical protein